MTLGEQIRQAREKKNLSQEELADRLHVSRQAISKWENNNSVPQGINRELLTHPGSGLCFHAEYRTAACYSCKKYCCYKRGIHKG